MNIPQDIKDIHQIMRAANKQLFVVGGCVRDHLTGSQISDYDMATDAMPDEVISLLNDKYFLDFTGKSFGVVRVRTKDCPKGYEIATFREDITVGRQPEVRLGATIEDDVKRRDFTINALFYDLDKDEIIDLVGGVDDLENKILRCVGIANDRFDEDRLRVLRAIRFAVRLGLTICKETHDAILKCRLLEGQDKDGSFVPVVRERINDEMFKMFEQTSNPVLYFQMLDSYDLLDQVLPGYIKIDKWIDTRSPEVLIASMYYTGFVKNEVIDKLSSVLKFPNKLIDGISLLLNSAEAINYNDDRFYDFAYSASKYRKSLHDVTDEHLFVFLQWSHEMNSANANARMMALSAYRTTVTGKELIDEGFAAGEELGIEIKKRERTKFNQLLQRCGRMFRSLN